MYPFCNCHNENPPDCCTEPSSESEEAYDIEACFRYKNSNKIENSDFFNCCEYKKKQKKLAKGKFGLAYVIETPKHTITRPTGWQVEFQDTPSKIENNCETMMRWANRPPLGECPTFSNYPTECGVLLHEYNERKGKFSKVDNVQSCRRYKQCSCQPDYVCINGEQCKKNTRRSPRKLIVCKDDTYYDNIFCKKEQDNRTVCLCEQVLQNKYGFDPEKLKCKCCQKNEQSNVCSTCCNSKLSQEKQKIKFSRCKDEGDLDYVPKRDNTKKKVKNTQTSSKESKKYEDPDKTKIKEDKNDKSIIHKIETKAVVDIRFSDKGVEVKNRETTETSTLKPLEQNNEAKQTETSTLKPLGNRNERKLENRDKKVQNFDLEQDVKNFGNLQEELQQKLIERAKKKEEEQPKENVEGLLEETQTPEQIVEIPEEEKDVAKIVENVELSKDDFKILNHKHLTKNEIFTNDMTPLQKLKLARKIQKQEILESKLAQNQPQRAPEKLIGTLDLQT